MTKSRTRTRYAWSFISTRTSRPIKVAVLPLSRKENLATFAKDVYGTLRPCFTTQYDDTQSIGRRYRRQDELGTPYCVTIDFQSLEDNMAPSASATA